MGLTDQSEKNRSQQKRLLSGSSWNILGVVLGCSFAGYFLGAKWGDRATGTMIGAGVGLIYVVYAVWQMVRDNSNKT